MQELKSYCVFCEDVRKELDGKLSLMGTYGSKAIFEGDFPAAIKLSTACYLRNIDPKKQNNVVFKLINGEEQILSIVPEMFKRDDRDSIILIAEFGNYPVERTGSVEVFLQVEDLRTLIGNLLLTNRNEFETNKPTQISD